MKGFYLFCLSALYILTAHSQNRVKDSLFKQLNSSRNDSNKVNILSELSQQYIRSKPDTSLLLSRQALDLSQQLNYKSGEAKALNSMALAMLYVNDRSNALQTYLKALKIYETLNDEVGIAATDHNIGLSYWDQQEYTLALNYLNKSRMVNKKLHNDSGILNNFLIVAACYEQMKYLDSAILYGHKAYSLAFNLPDSDKIGMAARILGDIYAEMGKDSLALNSYRIALSNHIRTGNQYGLSKATLGLAQIFLKIGVKDSALYYARLSLITAQKGGFPQLILNTCSFLSDYFKNIHQIDNAYAYQQIAITIKDTLFNQEKIKSLQLLTFEEKQRQQDIAFQKQQEAKERKTNLQFFGIVIFIPLFFGLVLLLTRSKMKPDTIELLGTLSLLFLYEFIVLLIHPLIEKWTHHNLVLMLVILVGIGSVLVPLHHYFEHKIKNHLAKRQLKHQNTKPGSLTIIDQPVNPELNQSTSNL
jgi:tetratricopeptide (TPR) repeat protein